MPVITQPTRLSHTSATLIDNILISQQENENFNSYILTDNISNHLPCICTLQDVKTMKNDKKTFKSRNLKRINTSRLKEEPNRINWTEMFAPHTTFNDKMDKMLNELTSHINHFLPYKTISIPYHKLCRELWITPAVMKSINKGKSMYRKQLHGDSISRVKYKEYSSIFKKVKRYAKKQYYIDKCTKYKSNTKQL